MRWQGLRDLLRCDDRLRAHIDGIYRQRTLTTHRREIPIFRQLKPGQLDQVMAQTQFTTYGDYDWSGDYKRLAKTGSVAPETETSVAQEGDYPNSVILIRSGFARPSQKFGRGHRTSNYLGAGREFGLREIAQNWRDKTATIPFQHPLRVVGYTHILTVPTAVMEEVVFPNLPPEMGAALVPAQPVPAAAAAPPRTRGPDALPLVTKPIIPDRWLPRGNFHHAKHAISTCAQCHDQARSRDTAQIMLPTKQTCVHGHSSAGGVSQSCSTCHSYPTGDRH